MSPASPPETRDADAPTVLIAHPSAELYGSDRVMLDTVSALVARGWTVFVTLPTDGPLVEGCRAAGATVLRCGTPVLRKSALRPKGFVSFVASVLSSLRPGMAVLRTTRPDVVYVSTITAPLWLLLARLRRHPVVCHLHEAEVGLPRLVGRVLVSPLLLADVVISNSTFSLEVATAAIPRLRARSIVVSNPVPGPVHPAAARAILDPPIRLLYVGRLSPRKGPQHVIEAVEVLRARGSHCHLAILGSVFEGYEWFERELHEAVSRAGLDEQVDFLGFRPDVWPVIAAADLVIVPSVMHEPFGNTAVEALLAGRPVVASALGGLLEAVSGYDSARSVPPADPTAIADAVASITSDWTSSRVAAERDAIAAAVRHSPERYGDRIDRVLTALLADTGRC